MAARAAGGKVIGVGVSDKYHFACVVYDAVVRGGGDVVEELVDFVVGEFGG